MRLDSILAITGKPGLFEMKVQTREGLIAESLLDGKKLRVTARHQVSVLSEIAIYTLHEEMPLPKVFKTIFEKLKGEKALSHKASKEALEAFFFEVLPDYDEDRVYVSDIKKIVQWYNLLHDQGMPQFIDDIVKDTNNKTKEENPTN